MKRNALLFEILSGAAATALMPVVLLKGALSREFARSLKERLVCGGWSKIQPGERSIWLHGASVGEIQGVAPVAQELKSRGHRLFLTTTSLTGQQMVQSKKLSGASCLLPLDHPFLVRQAIQQVRPKIGVIFETELWPNLLFAFRRANIPVLLVNARISDRTVSRYLRFRSFFAAALEGVERVLVQSELDRERFIALGVPAERVIVNGSTKFDVEPRGQGEGFSRSEAPRFVAGSVRPGEEEIVLDAFVEARKQVPDLELIFAPRHLERVEPVLEMMKVRGLSFGRRSLQQRAQGGVLVLDTLGELQSAYASATVAFVGGTLVPIGGHNPLEPAAEGVPVLVGPYTENVRGPVQALTECGGGEVVADTRALSASVVSFCLDRSKAVRACEGARRAWTSQRGATARVVALIEEVLLRGSESQEEKTKQACG